MDDSSSLWLRPDPHNSNRDLCIRVQSINQVASWLSVASFPGSAPPSRFAHKIIAHRFKEHIQYCAMGGYPGDKARLG